MPKKSNPELLSKAVELYLRGITAYKVGKMIGLSECTVLRAVRARGILKKNDKNCSDGEIKTIVELYNKGQTTDQIGPKVGRSKSVCIRILNKLGILNRSRSLKDRQALVDVWECIGCKEIRPSIEFKRPGEYGTERCPACWKKQQAKDRASNKQGNKESTRKFKDKIRAFVDGKKSDPCLDCGKRFLPYCMEFDHLTDKIMAISGMVARHWKIEKIAKEIEKCDLVCVLCHRNRTYSRARLDKPPLLPTTPALERQRHRRAEGIIFLHSLKIGPCKDCNNSYNPWQMDFDHRDPATKTNSVGKLVNCSDEHILAEIAKCDLVCVACRRVRTHEKGHYRLDDSIKQAKKERQEAERQKEESFENEAIAKYLSGLNTTEAARPRSNTWLGDLLRKRGIPMRSISEAKSSLKQNNAEEIIKLYVVDGLACAEIGRRFGVKDETVRLFLEKMNVPRRPRTTKQS